MSASEVALSPIPEPERPPFCAQCNGFFKSIPALLRHWYRCDPKKQSNKRGKAVKS
jgi:hypothetical protein